MLIEQIFEYKLRGSTPHRICTLTSKTGYLHDKTKICKANFQVNYYLPLKLLQ